MLPSVSSAPNRDIASVAGGSNPPTNANAPQMPASMLAAKMSVDFVNLYEVLELSETTDPTVIRKRIGVMYLEAQKNQDHRNPQKKMFFQQMYEVYLPQARHLLLDGKRRGEYDAYLASFREDEKRSQEVENALVASSDSPEEARRMQAEERVLEETLTPEQLAARRVQLWKRWEEGLKSMTGELAQLTFSPVELKARAVERKEYMERMMVEVIAEDKRREAARERQRLLEAAKREEEQQIARAAELSKRREVHFTEHSVQFIKNARMIWGAGSGLACFLLFISFVLVILVRFIDALAYMGIPVAFVAAIFAAWKGSMHGATQMTKASEQKRNLQKEAERRAIRVLEERRHKDGAKEMTFTAAAQEAEALRTEIQEQAAALHRADISELAVKNTSASWAFGVGDTLFLLGCVALYGLDVILKKASTSTITIVAVIGWIALATVCYSLWQGVQNQILGRFKEKRDKENRADKLRFQS